MEFEQKEEFPCGLKVSIRTKSGFFDFFSCQTIDSKEPTECPLHGKECPPKK